MKELFYGKWSIQYQRDQVYSIPIKLEKAMDHGKTEKNKQNIFLLYNVIL